MAFLKIKVIDPTSVWRSQEREICKFTYGQPKPSASSCTEKVLMLVGGTGAGKSTLINGFVNYIMGVNCRDYYRYKLIGAESQRSQAYSQTSWVTAYTFNQEDYPRLPYTFTIIDTPGYGDTEGLKRDQVITKQIQEFFTLKGPQGIDHLDGIGFVVQNSNAKLNVAQGFLFDSILTLFGKDLRDNIFMMITFADGKTPPVLEAIKVAKINYRSYFKFNNSALFPDTEEQMEDLFTEPCWKLGEKSFESFFKSFSETKSVKLFQTIKVLDERDQLQCILQGLEENIRNGIILLGNFETHQKVMKDHEADLLRNQDFIYYEEVIKQRQHKLSRGEYVTNCLTCNRTCHYPCKIANPKGKDKCSVMDKTGYCQICPRHPKCHWKSHYTQDFRIETYTEIEKKTSAELKNKYEKALSSKTAIDNSIKEIKEKVGKIRNEVLILITEAGQKIQRLEEIALRPGKKSEIDYIDLLIEQEKQQAEPGFLDRISELGKVRKQAVIMCSITDKKEREEHLKKVQDDASCDLLAAYLREIVIMDPE